MRLRIGSYRFPIAASEIIISRDPLLNALQVPYAVEEVWSIRSRLRNPTGEPKDFRAILNSFEAACVNGADVVLELSDGAPSHHVMRSRDLVGGTRFSRLPGYPTGRGAQGITYRDVAFEVRGTRPVAGLRYVQFTEQITVSGGGARTGCREVNVGPGVQQRLRTHTTCFATQTGSAVGYLGYPDPPNPIWPFALVDQYPDLGLTGANTLGAGVDAIQTDHPINWSYRYEWPYRLTGIPHYLLGF